ncbi:MAG: sulfonate transporter substrate-binding protein [Actinomycetia bacterium]|nr:sulfonate transporter substrate-binding protein [Actinomycetes bacterium]
MSHRPRPRRRRITRITALLALSTLALAGLGAGVAGAATKQAQVTLRLGYFPNVTHGSAIVGVESGIFAKKLGNNVTLKTSSFNAGPDEVQALFSDALDIAYIGPSPSVTAYQQSHGQAIRIISGAASGGASLVVKPTITKAADLKGKKLASPQLGNTQDVALRSWLLKKGLKTTTSGGGDVSILPQDNATTLASFQAGSIDGAWVPEPWASRLVAEGGGKVLVNEASLWPKGQFVTTQVIVRTAFLKDHPDAVKKFLAGQVATTDYIAQNPVKAQALVGQGITKLTGKPLSASLIASSFKTLQFTNDPISSSLRADTKNAEQLGLLSKVDLKGIYDLKLLNQVLKAQGKPAVKG